MSDWQRMSKTPALSRGELTEQETLKLMQAFVFGKTEILEEDAVTLLRWATEMRLGAMLVDMMIAGEVLPVVHEGTVKVVLAPGSRN